MPRLVCDPFNYVPYIVVQARDLNLGCWEDKTYRHCLRVNFELNDSYEPVHCPAENIWPSGHHSSHPRLHYIHQNTQWLPWVIRNQPFNDYRIPHGDGYRFCWETNILILLYSLQSRELNSILIRSTKIRTKDSNKYLTVPFVRTISESFSNLARNVNLKSFMISNTLKKYITTGKDIFETNNITSWCCL